MKSFNEILNELYSVKNYNKKMIKNDSGHYTVEVKLSDGLLFLVEIEKIPTFLIPAILRDKIISLGNKNSDIWEISFLDEEDNYSKTPKRSGASIELFSIIESIIRDFLKEKKPEKFIFSSVSFETSRSKLYSLLAKKISKLTKYKYELTKSSIHDYFIFYK